MPSEHGRPWMARVALIGAYTALAVLLTWPLAASLMTHLPLGSEGVASVPFLNAWTVWWNADRAGYGFSGYWHAPIFHPARYAFAFSEAQPTTLVVGLLVPIGGPALAYNVYLLGVLTLNGLVAFRLLSRVGLATVPAMLGGTMAETLPFVHWQLGVLQLATLCGVLWVFDRLVALRNGTVSGRRLDADAPEPVARAERALGTAALELSPSSPVPPSPLPPIRVRDALLLGVAAAICYAACNYWGLYLSVLLPLALPPLAWGRWRDWRFWASMIGVGALAAALCGPILWAQWKAKAEYDWEREESLLVDLSAQPRDYATTPWPAAVPAFEPQGLKDPSRALWMLGPGTEKVALAAAGIVVGLLTRGRRRWTLFLLLLAGWAFFLSLGPKLEIVEWNHWRMRTDSAAAAAGWVPYHLLMKVHPGLSLARSPFRFAFFVQIATVLLAANLLDGLWRGGRWLARDWRPAPQRAFVTTASAAAVLLGVFAVTEVWPQRHGFFTFHRQRLYALPSLDQAWIRWLRENTDPRQPIVDLPFPTGARVDDYERTARFMYEQIGHRRPMVQGYSGFFPDDFLELKDRIPSLPDVGLLDDLYARDVRHVVATTPEWTAKLGRSGRLRLVFRDEVAKVSVYSLLPSPGAVDGRKTIP